MIKCDPNIKGFLSNQIVTKVSKLFFRSVVQTKPEIYEKNCNHLIQLLKNVYSYSRYIYNTYAYIVIQSFCVEGKFYSQYSLGKLIVFKNETNKTCSST